MTEKGHILTQTFGRATLGRVTGDFGATFGVDQFRFTDSRLVSEMLRA